MLVPNAIPDLGTLPPFDVRLVDHTACLPTEDEESESATLGAPPLAPLARWRVSI
jgi:hypothetical protein